MESNLHKIAVNLEDTAPIPEEDEVSENENSSPLVTSGRLDSPYYRSLNNGEAKSMNREEQLLTPNFLTSTPKFPGNSRDLQADDSDIADYTEIDIGPKHKVSDATASRFSGMIRRRESNSSSDLAHATISSDDDSFSRSDTDNSGVYVPGYTGPIHKWQHPGYHFISEPLTDRFPKSERLFKVIIVGDATVGKTTFVQRYVNNVFRSNYKGTVGVDFALKILWKSDTDVIKLQMWDIAGQERFTWMTRAYYRDAHGCIVMFDLTNNSSFINAMKWKTDVDSKCHLPDGSLVPAILIGNKCDLPHRAVNQEQVELVYNTHNYIGWTEVSAKDDLMVHDSMKFLVDAMISRNIGDVSYNDVNTSLIVEDKPKKKNRRCC